MRIGITGTREGVSFWQKSTLQSELASVHRRFGRSIELHHGDCVGVDAYAHAVAEKLGFRIVLHPPVNSAFRAMCPGNELRVARPFLERNRHIVEACDLLLAFPRGFQELKRSGTWATVAYARSIGRRLRIIWPDGTVEEEQVPPEIAFG